MMNQSSNNNKNIIQMSTNNSTPSSLSMHNNNSNSKNNSKNKNKNTNNIHDLYNNTTNISTTATVRSSPLTYRNTTASMMINNYRINPMVCDSNSNNNSIATNSSYHYTTPLSSPSSSTIRTMTTTTTPFTVPCGGVLEIEGCTNSIGSSSSIPQHQKQQQQQQQYSARSMLTAGGVGGGGGGSFHSNHPRRITRFVIALTTIIVIAITMNFFEGSYLPFFVTDPMTFSSSSSASSSSSSSSSSSLVTEEETSKAKTNLDTKDEQKDLPKNDDTSERINLDEQQKEDSVLIPFLLQHDEKEVEEEETVTMEMETSPPLKQSSPTSILDKMKSNDDTRNTVSWLTYTSTKPLFVEGIQKRNSNSNKRINYNNKSYKQKSSNTLVLIGNGTQFAERWCDLSGSPNHGGLNIHWYPTKNGTKAWQYRAPIALLPGAANSGTKYLQSLLNQHPYIIPSKRPELQFFYDHSFRKFVTTSSATIVSSSSSVSTSGTVDTTTADDKSKATKVMIEKTKVLAARERMYAQDYQQSILQRNESYVSFDATSGYLFYSSFVPRRILCVTPWIKLIVVLRDPVERVIAQYNAAVSTRGLKIQFHDWINNEMMLLQSTGVLPVNYTTIHTVHVNSSSPQSIKNSSLPSPTVQVRVPLWNSEDDYLNYTSGTTNNNYTTEDMSWYEYQTQTLEGPIGRSLYVIQLRQWFHAIRAAGRTPKDEVLILYTDHLLESTRDQYNRILQFLQLPPHQALLPQSTSSSSSSSGSTSSSAISSANQPSNVSLSSQRTNNSQRNTGTTRTTSSSDVTTPQIKQLLERFFEPYNNQLIRLLKQYDIQTTTTIM